MDLTDAIGEFEPGVAGQTVRAVRRRMNVEDRMPGIIASRHTSPDPRLPDDSRDARPNIAGGIRHTRTYAEAQDPTTDAGSFGTALGRPDTEKAKTRHTVREPVEMYVEVEGR